MSALFQELTQYETLPYLAAVPNWSETYFKQIDQTMFGVKASWTEWGDSLERTVITEHNGFRKNDNCDVYIALL